MPCAQLHKRRFRGRIKGKGKETKCFLYGFEEVVCDAYHYLHLVGPRATQNRAIGMQYVRSLPCLTFCAQPLKQRDPDTVVGSQLVAPCIFHLGRLHPGWYLLGGQSIVDDVTYVGIHELDPVL